jgi:hypothetical protein
VFAAPLVVGSEQTNASTADVLTSLQTLEWWLRALLHTDEHRAPSIRDRPENLGARSALQFLAIRVRRASRAIEGGQGDAIGKELSELMRFCEHGSSVSRMCELSQGRAIFLATLAYRLEIEDALERLVSMHSRWRASVLPPARKDGLACEQASGDHE